MQYAEQGAMLLIPVLLLLLNVVFYFMICRDCWLHFSYHVSLAAFRKKLGRVRVHPNRRDNRAEETNKLAHFIV